MRALVASRPGRIPNVKQGQLRANHSAPVYSEAIVDITARPSIRSPRLQLSPTPGHGPYSGVVELERSAKPATRA